ncbi:MAG: heavy metal transport/detoxification protein [Planctomycetes bacterium]|nr:heavy metal transport/detoxification protein [Planctomycetota bacterium]
MVLNIKGMTCGGCAGKVKSALTNCPGVKDAQVDHKSGKAVVEVESGEADIEALIKSVKKLGYTVTEG